MGNWVSFAHPLLGVQRHYNQRIYDVLSSNLMQILSIIFAGNAEIKCMSSKKKWLISEAGCIARFKVNKIFLNIL